MIGHKKNKYQHKPKAIDLFSGCGGLTQGLKDAGFIVISGIDINKIATKTYEVNHPEVELWEMDICKLKVSALKKKLNLKKGELDLLAGCPPCQGFSSMRTLNGSFKIDDPRNNLLLEFQRFVEELKPKTVMLENVPGLAKEMIFKNFCERLSELGYIGEYKILNAAEYGVPQRRHRLIYLAGLGTQIAFASPTKEKVTVRDAIGSLAPVGKSGDPIHDISENRSIKVKRLIKKIPKDGGSRTDLPYNAQLNCHKRCNGFKDVYGRMAWDDVAPTITSGCFNPSKGRFIHPIEDRAITLREAALLQGFPIKYQFPINNNKSAIALMIGNALPPPFISAHAKEIKKLLLR